MVVRQAQNILFGPVRVFLVLGRRGWCRVSSGFFASHPEIHGERVAEIPVRRGVGHDHSVARAVEHVNLC